MLGRVYLALELTAIFIGIPLLFVFRILPGYPLVLLMLVALAACAYLKREETFPTGWLLNGEGARRHWRQVALRSLVLAAALGALVVVWMPGRLFDCLRQTPLLWAALMVLYPVLSVYPQELVYRAFFFHRYEALFAGPRSMMLASATVFAFAHVVMGNWLSVVLSAAGGLLFAQTYQKSRSLLLTSLEHALFGNFIFTIGLGQFFMHR